MGCIDKVVATDYGCVPNSSCKASFDEFAAFAKCRLTYFKNWTSFQGKKSLTGSTCVGTRFVDNGDGTVTNGLTTLVWEKKTNDATVHDEGNVYTWSTGTNTDDGTAFTSFLATVNGGGGFAGANGWRLPTLAELQTIVEDFACTKSSCNCGSPPCLDGTFSPTPSNFYWSATSYVLANLAWYVSFDQGAVYYAIETVGLYVRAVRGGL